jgi:uncharacterized RDD family membrane protein YckC
LHPTDKLSIDTPEQIALELPLAGIGSRSLAITIDSVIQIVIYIIVLIAVGLPLSLMGGFFKDIQTILLVLLLFFFFWGYFAFFEIIWNGQTPGKRLVRIRIIKESGRPITAIEAIARNLVRVVDFFPGIYAVGLICMFLNKRNKRLGDFIAGTIAVHDKAIEKVSAIWNPGSVTTAANPQAVKISSEELVLIEAFLNRRTELNPQVRKQTAAQIASLIQNKLGTEREPGQSDESFLAAVARQVRDAAGYR